MAIAAMRKRPGRLGARSGLGAVCAKPRAQAKRRPTRRSRPPIATEQPRRSVGARVSRHPFARPGWPKFKEKLSKPALRRRDGAFQAAPGGALRRLSRRDPRIAGQGGQARLLGGALRRCRRRDRAAPSGANASDALFPRKNGNALKQRKRHFPRSCFRRLDIQRKALEAGYEASGWRSSSRPGRRFSPTQAP